jgi:hypothetical protein
MKTLLPEKMYSIKDGEIAKRINEIITYLAELTEVVEGKQTPDVITEDGRLKPLNVYQAEQVTLKEQLLGALPKRKVENVTSHVETYDNFIVRNSECVGYNKALADVEAIINRLIP